MPRLVASLFWLTPFAARAAGEPCPTTGSATFTCQLRGILHLLSATAIVLGILLLLAVLAAVWFYRRSRDTNLLP